MQKLTQWLSPAFPVGAFAFSHGLEWAISNRDVTNEISARQWIATCLNFGTGVAEIAAFIEQSGGLAS